MKALAFFLSVLSVSSTIANLHKAEVSALWNLGRTVVYVCNPVQLGKLGHELPVTFMKVASTGLPLEIDKYWPDKGDTVVAVGPSEQNKSGVTKIAEFSRNLGIHSGTTYTFTEIVDSPAGPIHLVQEVTGTAAKSRSRVGVAVPSAKVRELYDDTNWHQIEVSSNNGQGKVVVSYCSYHSRSLPTTVSVLDPYATHQGTSIAHRITQSLWTASSALLGVGFVDVLAKSVDAALRDYREKITAVEDEKQRLQKELNDIYNKPDTAVHLYPNHPGPIYEVKRGLYDTKDQWDQVVQTFLDKGYKITAYQGLSRTDEKRLKNNLDELKEAESAEQRYVKEMQEKGLDAKNIMQEAKVQAERMAQERAQESLRREEELRIKQEAESKRIEDVKAKEKKSQEEKSALEKQERQKRALADEEANRRFWEQEKKKREDARFEQNVRIAVGATVVVVLTTAMIAALTIAPTPFSNMVYVIECKQ